MYEFYQFRYEPVAPSGEKEPWHQLVNKTDVDSKEVLTALRNFGIDTECGSCMEIAFTGVTTHEHTCSDHPRVDVTVEPANSVRPPVKP